MNADAAAVEADAQEAKRVQDALDAEASKEKEVPRPSQLTEEEEEVERIRRSEAKFPGLTKKAAAQAAKDAERLEREKRRLEGFAADKKKKKAASSVSAPKKRKREASKKAQIADLLNEVTETVITSTSQQATPVEEDEDEEHLQTRNNKLEADLKAVTEQVTELIKAKLAADKAIEEANALAAQHVQDALDEETRKKKEAPRSDANFNERLRILTAKNPELAKSIAAQEAKEAKRFNAEKQMYDEYAKDHKKTQAAPSSSVPATRKRKTPSKKAQVTEMLGRITETVVDPPLNPTLQTEDDLKEDLEPQPTRHQVFDAVLVRTVGQPFPPHPDTK
ncbi:stress response protein NST1-like [Impatiens glandulifera]|uniref:stress response protein NST1-like n=1 Tax=Impatiens glandulifera TaxID=253017 RepID=UPI001FB15ABE|nr:stress response protein NST1-like [Impatiens glandulifera]